MSCGVCGGRPHWSGCPLMACIGVPDGATEARAGCSCGKSVQLLALKKKLDLVFAALDGIRAALGELKPGEVADAGRACGQIAVIIMLAAENLERLQRDG